MRWVEQARQLFGPDLENPLDNNQTREGVSRYRERELIAEAEEEWRGHMADEHFEHVIEPRLDEIAESLGLSRQQLTEEVQNPKFRIILRRTQKDDISFLEAKRALALEKSQQLELLPEAVGLTHPVMNSRFGTETVPKHKQRYPRRVLDDPSKKQPTKTSIAKWRGWRRSVARFAEQRATEAINIDQIRPWDQEPPLPSDETC